MMTAPAPARIALVTGASSGIGQAIAAALAARGMGLWLVARRAARLEAAAADIRRVGAPVYTCALDLRDDAGLAGLAERLRAADGLDVLVHSAGAHFLGVLGTASVTELDHQYQVNLRAPYLLTQLLLPLLRARRGQVVFVNSTAGLEARPCAGAYSATKHGLKALADALRQEVNSDGVRVLSIYPGRTATPMQQRITAEEGKTYQPERLVQPADVAATVISALEMERSAEVTDIRLRSMAPPVRG